MEQIERELKGLDALPCDSSQKADCSMAKVIRLATNNEVVQGREENLAQKIPSEICAGSSECFEIFMPLQYLAHLLWGPR